MDFLYISNMETLELSYIDSGLVYGSREVKIKFKTSKKLRSFINSDERIFKIKSNQPYKNDVYKIVKIKKIMHYSIEAIIEIYTLREMNLERLGI